MNSLFWIAILHSKRKTMMNAIHHNNRILSIDLARGLAVLFMIAVHTLMVFANQEVQDSVFGQIIEFLGGPPAAPVFMTLMGFSYVYSRKSELKSRLTRGLKILLSGYLLNILRGVIPFTLSAQLHLDITETFPLNELNEYTILTIVDILQFAGIALMIMALIQEFKINKYVILFTAILISMISPFFWGLHLNLPVIDHILELFWGDQPIAYSFIDNKISFPVLPWLSFPLLGMFLGITIKRSNDQSMTFKHFGIIGISVLLLGVAISYSDIEYHFNDYYHSRQGGMLFMHGFVLFWLYFTKLILDKVHQNKVFDLLFKWSNGVTNIYFAQWIIIIWSIPLFGINQNSLLSTILLIMGFTILSHFINECISHFLNKRTT
jgi:uncharacterized membrane protein